MSSSPPPALIPESLIQAGQNVVATKYYLAAAFTILLYDHMISFSDELEYIWKKKWGMTAKELLPESILYPGSHGRHHDRIIKTQSPQHSSTTVGVKKSVCKKFVPFEPFGFGIPLIAVPGFLLILRVYALYGRNFYVLVYLAVLLLAQVTVGIWQFAFPGGGPVMFPDVPGPVFHGCLYTAAPSLGAAAGAYLVVDLFFDVSIFALTMARTWKAFWNHRGPGLLRRISQDGAVYFVMIFTLNSVWLFMVLFATPTLKYINALPAIMLDVTMINRLTMSLRRGDDQPPTRPSLEERPVARLGNVNMNMTPWSGYPTNPFTHISKTSLAVDDHQDYELATIVV
ncbi:hypothetical protein K439DRAFT_1664259 [Ramaria rubella]|nr:hypothetical protein K439DRAFT_1664259 [Ramaria rubella]